MYPTSLSYFKGGLLLQYSYLPYLLSIERVLAFIIDTGTVVTARQVIYLQIHVLFTQFVHLQGSGTSEGLDAPS